MSIERRYSLLKHDHDGVYLTIADASTTYLTDAPSDGSEYVRKNGAWAVATGGGATWGSITGTLSSQTDLNTALNAKLSLTGGSMTGGLTISVTDTHLTLFETDASDPSDRAFVQVSGNLFVVQGYDASAAATRTFMSCNITTGVSDFGNGIRVSSGELSNISSGYAYLQTSVGTAPKITRGTGSPSGGNDGDIYLQYT